jgi:hypothetical protein
VHGLPVLDRHAAVEVPRGDLRQHRRVVVGGRDADAGGEALGPGAGRHAGDRARHGLPVLHRDPAVEMLGRPLVEALGGGRNGGGGEQKGDGGGLELGLHGSILSI